ncbi:MULTISPECIES: spore coat protein CotJB [Thermoactinomyces]|jgi:spore coat protein JB|uniref:Spore coat protein CotJB n=1 Tax=Thermoactinomyces daqus TaxID=1329516 RepID=A0A7W1X844_9BACL|nr:MULTISPECIES: spore coat protein CotJB [Thermoactinomyces]MBA4541719.1 spore coat protein CotJB [Thermoactinomyces daqus]MBH8597196.1 spore coat protein CotJB [Thermoactinomyces sp. CICC 10523]MBH8602756.1 spore coat protein CotJB [Thermoactinomyces sp. CICC 10522]MBH8606135.1 spore coat protein CotJB [Thermoactinomyces sp. CICC 10521]
MNQKHQRELLRQLQEIDFVLVELNLYLDTHPSDLEALQQFNWYVNERKKIARTYEEHYGPLRNFGQSMNQYPNGWNEGPWPWEI